MCLILVVVCPGTDSGVSRYDDGAGVLEAGRIGCAAEEDKAERLQTNISVGMYGAKPKVYRGTPLVRKHTPLGPYRRPMPSVVWRS